MIHDCQLYHLSHGACNLHSFFDVAHMDVGT